MQLMVCAHGTVASPRGISIHRVCAYIGKLICCRYQAFIGYNVVPLTSETRETFCLKLGISDYLAEPTSVHYHIKHFDFDVVPESIPLSCVWGAESLTFVIVVNGVLLEIRQNLFNIL